MTNIENNKLCAYLDIETTGLSPSYSELTVIGILTEDGYDEKFIQLIGDDISSSRLLEIFENVKVLYTYNGSKFDLPFIKSKLGIDIKSSRIHNDLMFDCWKRNLFGGLKNVERTLGINRELKEVDGQMAVILWNNYRLYGDKNSLETLLEYNREDVLNLKALRQKLNI